MLILRSALFNAFFFTLTPLFSLLIICVRIFGVNAAWAIAKAWSYSTLILLRVICGVQVEIEGREHIPEEPCVVLANHQSAMETVLMPLLVPPFVWILKRELFYLPLFGWALWVLDAIAIRRSNPREALKQVISQGTNFLQRHRWVVVFPEGSRMAVGEIGQYQSGGVLLAKKAKVSILPLAHNAGRCWPKRGFIKHPGTVTFRFLPAISATTVATTERAELIKSLQISIQEGVS
ncbi:MAG: lysophospholipid acyltransferase family protein [Mariprofundaceae bacterium]